MFHRVTTETCFFSHSYPEGHTLQLFLTSDNTVKYTVIKGNACIQNAFFRIMYANGKTETSISDRLVQRILEKPSMLKIRHLGPTLILIDVDVQGPGGTKEREYVPHRISPEAKENKVDYSSGYLHIAPRERKKSTTPIPVEPCLSAMSSTRLLAESIKALAKKSDQELARGVHDDLVRFVRKSIMKAFDDKEMKPRTPRILEELTELTFSHNKEICQDVLDKIFSELKGATFKNGNIDLLEALQHVLSNTPAEFFEPNTNQLLEILDVITSISKEFHQQYETMGEYLSLIDTLTSILMVMNAAGVQRLNFDKIHDPLYQLLDAISKDQQLSIFTNKKAKLAQEALKRISHSKSSFERAVDRFCALAKTTAIAATRNPAFFAYGFQQLKVAMHSQDDAEPWYLHFRFLDILIKDKQWAAFESHLEIAIKGISEEEYAHMLPLVIYSLNQIIASDLELPADRKKAFKILHNLYIQDGKYSLRQIILSALPRWTDKAGLSKAGLTVDSLELIREKMHVEILRQFKDYARWETDEELRDLARDKIKIITSSNLRGVAERRWFEKVGLSSEMNWDALGFLQPRPLKIKERTNALIQRAKEIQLDVGAKIRDLQVEHGNPDAPHVKARLATFGDLLVKEVATGKTVLGKARLLEWLNSNERVALLESTLGGAGKTTIVKVIHHEAWKMAKEKTAKMIIVEIRADTIQKSPKGAISRALTTLGFSPDSFSEMQKTCTIVACIDECEILGIQGNIFMANNEWPNLRILYTSRAAHLPTARNELVKRLNPEGSKAPILHLKLLPFDETTSIKTLEKYVEHDPRAPRHLEILPETPATPGAPVIPIKPYAEWDFKKYEEYLKALPYLKREILHPATLVAFFNGLPSLVSNTLSTAPMSPHSPVSIPSPTATPTSTIDRSISFSTSRSISMSSTASSPQFTPKPAPAVKTILPVDFYGFAIKEHEEYERDRVIRIVSRSTDPSVIDKYKIEGDFNENFEYYSMMFASYLASMNRRSFPYRDSIAAATSDIEKFLKDPTRLMYRETCLVYENGEYRFPQDNFFPYWLQRIIAEGLKMTLNSKTTTQTAATATQEINAHVFSTHRLEEDVIELLAQTVSRDQAMIELLKQFKNEWLTGKKHEIRGINSKNVLDALDKLNAWPQLGDTLNEGHSDLDDLKTPEDDELTFV